MSENLTNPLPPNAVEQILATLTAIDTRLTRLEERDEQRAYDTRPIWEQVLKRFDGLDEHAEATKGTLESLEEHAALTNAGLDSIEKRLDVVEAAVTSLRSEFDSKLEDLRLDMRAGFKRLERQMAQVALNVVAVRTDQSDLEERMDRIEDKRENNNTPTGK